MKKVVVWFLVILSFSAILLRFNGRLAELFFGIRQSSGISVLSDPTEAVVFVDGKEMGKTPYDAKNLAVKTYNLKIEKDKARWDGKVKLGSGTVTVVNRDLSSDQTSSAGEVLTLEKGKGLTIVSNPTGAEVEVDGKSVGKSPITVDAGSGEHTVLVSHSNYLNRSIRATLPDQYNLTISVDLALSEADLSNIQTPVLTETKQVVVKNTPVGFLRIRDKAALSGKEIGRVKPGDKLVLLEELGEWDRVRLADNTEGYVSAGYVEKQKP